MIKKNEKMCPESIKSLKEFNKKQIQSNITIHKIFLSMIIIINIFLIGFIFIYKSKISEIKSKFETHSLKLKENEKYISSLDSINSHKLVNIFAISFNFLGNYHFSLIFDTSEEVKYIKDLISSFIKIENPLIDLIYQGIYDGYDVEDVLLLIKYSIHTLIVLETGNGEKFGFFFNEFIDYEEDEGYKYFISESNNCFLFSLNYKEKYNCNSKGKITFEINGLGLFNIGNEDIIIRHDFKSDGGMINFPFKTFDIKQSDLGYGMFKKLTNYFDIFDIEIYSVWDF